MSLPLKTEQNEKNNKNRETFMFQIKFKQVVIPLFNPGPSDRTSLCGG
jgi:hypothetical protein